MTFVEWRPHAIRIPVGLNSMGIKVILEEIDEADDMDVGLVKAVYARKVDKEWICLRRFRSIFVSCIFQTSITDMTPPTEPEYNTEDPL